MTTPLDEFAKKLIERVRDDTIAGAGVLENARTRAPIRSHLTEFDQDCVNKALELLIPKIVDKTIFRLLNSADGGGIRLLYVADDGVTCDLEEEGMGELAGWLWGEDGWIASYSNYGPSE